jgi:hypothetical protein
MNNLIFNLRIWCLHFQVTSRFRPSIRYNDYHRGRGSRLIELYPS